MSTEVYSLNFAFRFIGEKTCEQVATGSELLTGTGRLDRADRIGQKVNMKKPAGDG